MRIDIRGAIIPNDHKETYNWLGIDAVCPKDVSKIIQTAKTNETFDIYIDSGGGDIFAGSSIYTTIKEVSSRVSIYITGLAASAASVIMCAAKSEISPTAMVMVHNVSTSVAGDYHDMDKQSEILKKANSAIAAAYVAKTGMTEESALSMMDGETWLTAKEAVKWGLVDNIMNGKEVLENPQLIAGYRSMMLSNEKLNKMKNILNLQGEYQADFLTLKMEQEQLNLLKNGGVKNAI